MSPIGNNDNGTAKPPSRVNAHLGLPGAGENSLMLEVTYLAVTTCTHPPQFNVRPQKRPRLFVRRFPVA